MNFLDVFNHPFQENTTIVMGYTVCAIAIVSFFATWIRWLQRHKILIGILFGLIAVGTDIASIRYAPELHQQGMFNVIVSISDAPVLVASFCFSPLSGIVAGVVATVERAILPLLGYESLAWYFSAGVTLSIALYGAALRKWVFNDETPLFLTGGIVAGYAEILRFSSLVFLLPYVTRFEEGKTRIYQDTLNEYLNAIFPLDKVEAFLENGGAGLSEGEFMKIKEIADEFATVLGNSLAETRCLDLIAHYLPYMTLGVAFATLAAILFTHPRNIKSIPGRLFSIGIPALCTFIIFVVGWGGIVVFSLENANRQSTQTLLNTSQGIYKKATDRVAFSMHSDAVAMRRSGCFRTVGNLTNEKLAEYAKKFNIDEISIFKRSGEFIASSAYKRLKPNVNNISNVSFWARFKDIYDTDANVYTGADGRFMYDVFDNEEPGDLFIDADPRHYAAYVAMTLSTQDRQECILVLGYTWQHVERDCIAFMEPLLKNMRPGKYGCVIAVKETPNQNGGISTQVFFPPYGHSETMGQPVERIGMDRGQWRNWESNVKIQDAEICGVWHFVLPLLDAPISMEDGGKLHLVLALPYAEHYFLAARQISVAGLVLFLTCILFIVMKIWTAKKQEVIDELRNADMGIAFRIQDAEMQDDWTDDGKPCRIISTMTPAKEVGGDFYDYYTLPDGRVALTIADVSGKGVPAAIFMMKAKFTLKNCLLAETNLPAAVNRANRLLCQHNDAQMFVTVWTGIFNPADNSLEFISAGHNPPLIKHCDGGVEWLKGALRKKPPLATFETIQYQSECIRLNPGDRLFLYTDGVTEAMNWKSELYGEERLEQALHSLGEGGTLNQIVGDSVMDFQRRTTAPTDPVLDKAVAWFFSKIRGEVEQSDDITMLTMEVKR